MSADDGDRKTDRGEEGRQHGISVWTPDARRKPCREWPAPLSRSPVSMLEMALARVRGRDDNADGFLVEPLETAVALEIFEMAAERAFLEKFVKLLLGDEFRGEQALRAFGADLPAFALGEGLFQEFEIREGIHGVNALFLQLIAEKLIIEARFEMVHTGVEKTFAVQADPEADRAELGRSRQAVAGKIDLGF